MDTPCTIGTGLRIRGRLSGSGNLVVHGRIEGTIELDAHVVIESPGRVVADIVSRELTVRGGMTGDTTASDRISITNGATLVGKMCAPRVVLEDGCLFTGVIEMDVPLPADI
jgi:cytoskeletal protein CcmA (bactofilin family)